MTDVRLGWHRQPRDDRDLLFRPGTMALPPAVDLTQTYSVPVVDQGQVGSCTGNGIAGALAYLQLQEKEALVYPSRLFIYYNERVIEGTPSQDSGANIRDGIKSVVDQGYCSELDWPYDINAFAQQPSSRPTKRSAWTPPRCSRRWRQGSRSSLALTFTTRS